MLIKKITVTKEDFNKNIRDILIDLNISPETVLVKINNQFTPISFIIKKETELGILVVVK
jgi:sulfur carrier protein ThiS